MFCSNSSERYPLKSLTVYSSYILSPSIIIYYYKKVQSWFSLFYNQTTENDNHYYILKEFKILHFNGNLVAEKKRIKKINDENAIQLLKK